jgi:hypothetical protein
LASTAWVYAPGTNNFPKTKRVCFCVRFPPLCVTYLQQHETVNMTHNTGPHVNFITLLFWFVHCPPQAHGFSTCLTCLVVPCQAFASHMRSNCLMQKKQIHTAIGRPFRMSVPVVAIYFFNKKKEKNAQRHGGP